MIGVHCVWLDDEELAPDGRARRRARLLPGSNMFLGDGITRITEMQALGVRIGLGTDGGCTNNRLSVFDEMRMRAAPASAAPRRHGAVRRGGLRAWGPRTAPPAGLAGREIAPGRLADLVAIDLGHPSLQPRDNLLKSVVYAMSPQAVTDVWVHGHPVVRDGRLATLDQDDLLARVRALTRDWRVA